MTAYKRGDIVLVPFSVIMLPFISSTPGISIPYGCNNAIPHLSLCGKIIAKGVE